MRACIRTSISALAHHWAAVMVQVEYVCSMCPTMPVELHRQLAVEPGASYSGVSQQFGAKSLRPLATAGNVFAVGLGSIRSSGTDWRCA